MDTKRVADVGISRCRGHTYEHVDNHCHHLSGLHNVGKQWSTNSPAQPNLGCPEYPSTLIALTFGTRKVLTVCLALVNPSHLGLVLFDSGSKIQDRLQKICWTAFSDLFVFSLTPAVFNNYCLIMVCRADEIGVASNMSHYLWIYTIVLLSPYTTIYNFTIQRSNTINLHFIIFMLFL